MRPSNRERSGSELVFGLLKTLMIAYQFWGDDGGIELSALSGSLHTSDHCIGGAVSFLAHEGWVQVDERTGIVRLTDNGVQHFLTLFEH